MRPPKTVYPLWTRTPHITAIPVKMWVGTPEFPGTLEGRDTAAAVQQRCCQGTLDSSPVAASISSSIPIRGEAGFTEIWKVEPEIFGWEEEES